MAMAMRTADKCGACDDAAAVAAMRDAAADYNYHRMMVVAVADPVRPRPRKKWRAAKRGIGGRTSHRPLLIPTRSHCPPIATATRSEWQR